MEAVTNSLVAAAPQLGVGGILLSLLVYVLRNWSTDRTDYRQGLVDAQARYATELSRINAAHDAEIAKLRKDVAELRTRVDYLNEVLDVERGLRRAAEDKAAEAQRRAGGTP